MGKKQVTLIGQVRQAASKSGISQNALARAAGMDPTALSRFVSGKRGLAMETLDALAAVLRLSIVAGKPIKPPPKLKPGRKPGRKAGRK